MPSQHANSFCHFQRVHLSKLTLWYALLNKNGIRNVFLHERDTIVHQHSSVLLKAWLCSDLYTLYCMLCCKFPPVVFLIKCFDCMQEANVICNRYNEIRKNMPYSSHHKTVCTYCKRVQSRRTKAKRGSDTPRNEGKMAFRR